MLVDVYSAGLPRGEIEQKSKHCDKDDTQHNGSPTEPVTGLIDIVIGMTETLWIVHGSSPHLHERNKSLHHPAFRPLAKRRGFFWFDHAQFVALPRRISGKTFFM
jgi:hypothetical protein